ncbi:LegC family aminotransferase [Salibacterium lacus]|uniref:LegC family aminotransferase n=1 Tax=Salibacterium lacus TaxID=1898109 RepID=A0ABW5T463_9BACI
MILESQILQAVQHVLPENDELKPLHAPVFQGNESKYVQDTIESTWVSSAGTYVNKLQEDLCSFTGINRAVTVVNGTAALQLALFAAGVEQGDEVLVPALTFVATANAVSHTGAVPHFVDVEESSLGIDVSKLEMYLKQHAVITSEGSYNKHTGRWIRAVVPMHTFGHPAAINQLRLTADRFHLKIVEDAAEALGSYEDGRHVGQLGDIAAVSFNGNKIITTGGGGALLTNNKDMADKVEHLASTAKVSHSFEFVHDEVGYNYRMPNINAALGCAQLEQLPFFLKTKRKLAGQYAEALSDISGISFIKERAGTRSNYWLNGLLLNEPDMEQRDRIIKKLHDHQILARPVWKPMHYLEMYRNMPKMDLTQTESLYARIINLPSGVM